MTARFYGNGRVGAGRRRDARRRSAARSRGGDGEVGREEWTWGTKGDGEEYEGALSARPPY